MADYAEYLSNGFEIPTSELYTTLHRIKYASFSWDYELDKTMNEYISDNQDPPKPKQTYIHSDD